MPGLMTTQAPQIPNPSPPQRGIVHQVSWREVLPSLTLWRAVWMAASPRTLLLAVLGIIATSLGWQVLASLFAGSDDAQVARQVQALRVSPWQWELPPVCPAVNSVVQGTPATLPGEGFQAASRFAVAPLGGTLFPPLSEWGIGSWALFAVSALWALVVWAWVGGAITRVTAVKYASEHYRFRAATRHASRKWVSYFSAPLLPLLFALVPALFILPLGLLSRIDIGFAISAVVWPLAVLAGLGIAVLVAGLALGWPLLWGNLSIEENTDAFDAVGRLYSYLGSRPIHYLMYLAMALLLGAFGWFVVAWLINLAYGFSSGIAGLLAGSDRALDWAAFGSLQATPEQLGVRPDTTGGSILRFWASFGRLLVTGYGVCFFWTAYTIVYFLLRQEVDRIPIDDVYRDEPEDTSDLPRLKPDSAGVASLADDGAEVSSSTAPAASPSADEQDEAL